MTKHCTSWYVYMLSCQDGTIYTGITTDLQRRIRQHNGIKGGAKYTRSRQPVRLIYWEHCKGRSEAAKREYQLKQLSALQKKALAAAFTKQLPD